MDLNSDQPTVTQALERFIARYKKQANRLEKFFPPVPYDPEWQSECQFCADDPTIWHPVKQTTPIDFSGLEHALELLVHRDIKAYFGSFWSATLEANAEEGPVSLIQLWNEQDFDRLIENLIGHAIAKKRSRQPMTVFVANTAPDSEYFLSIDNTTGTLVLEDPAKGVVKEVETSIRVFLDRLIPDLDPPKIY